jgi:hypothetical protein
MNEFMQITAFHFVTQIERAAESYFMQSMIFSSQKIVNQRFINFRKRYAGLDFYREDEEGESEAMGSLLVETIQETSEKIAFKCYATCYPSKKNKQFFLLLPAHRESYTKPTEAFEVLRKLWEKDPTAYLPKGDWSAAAPASIKASDPALDEYEGLTADEIEEITGVRPGASKSGKSSTPERASSSANVDDFSNLSINEIEALMKDGVPEEDEDDSTELSVEDIWKQISGGSKEAPPVSGKTPPATSKSTDNDAAFELLADDILKQMEDASQTSSPPKKKPVKKSGAPNEEPLNQSAEDIWKQISGGGMPASPFNAEQRAKDNSTPDDLEPLVMSAEDIWKQISGDSNATSPFDAEKTGESSSTQPIPEAERSESSISEIPCTESANTDDSVEDLEMSAEDIWKQISGGSPSPLDNA